MFVVRYLLVVVCGLLFNDCTLAVAVRCALFVVGWLLRLVAVCGGMYVVRCSLFVVGCLPLCVV